MRGYKGMMLVDGEDAYSEYGIFVQQYGYKALIQQPSFKKLTSTEWLEYDGEEVNLTAPVLDTKSFSISFCMMNKRYAEDFFDLLSNGAYHTFYFADLKRSYKLRMTSNGTFSSCIKMGNLALTFSQDDCSIPEAEPLDFGASSVKQYGYEIDEIDLSQFGANVLDGTDDNIRKAPSVRANLSVSTADKNGVVYDDANVFFKTKDVTLKLLIRAENIDEFWARWDALFCALMQPEARRFYFNDTTSEYECYYKSNSVTKFDILRNKHVWCEFSIVLTFTSSRPASSYMLLATEDDDWVITEESEDPARILIRPKSGISYLCMQDGSFVITEDEEGSRIYVNNV